MMGDVKDFLFYDIEVFSHNSMVVFKNYEEETVRVFSSSLDGLGELYDKHLIKDQGYADRKSTRLNSSHEFVYLVCRLLLEKKFF